MNKRTLAIARAVAVIGGTTALVAGVTFASATTNTVTAAGTVTVSDNLTISTASAGTYGSSATGFSFNTAPASPTVTPTDLYLDTTEPTGTVYLSAIITAWDGSLSAEAADLTANFRLGSSGPVVSVPLATLGSTDSSLAGIGALSNTSPNDLQMWITADSGAAVLNSANNFTLQLTGTNDGNVGSGT